MIILIVDAFSSSPTGRESFANFSAGVKEAFRIQSLIIGSGHSFHNMSGFSFGGNRDGVGAKGLDWDKALNEVATGDAKDRDRKLSNWRDLPGAREAHPREEHLMPLLVVAGAAGEDRGRNILNDAYMGVKASAFCFGGK